MRRGLSDVELVSLLIGAVLTAIVALIVYNFVTGGGP